MLGGLNGQSQRNFKSVFAEKKELTNSDSHFYRRQLKNAHPQSDVHLKTQSTNSTYWLPTQEKHFTYQTNNWVLQDSTRNYYHTTPGALAGKLDYSMNYIISSSQVYRDTFSYNPMGYETLSRYIEWGLPSYTVMGEYITSYYPSWKIKGYLSKWNQVDYNNCLPGGPVSKLVFSSHDTFIYNSANHLIVSLNKFYNLSGCNWNNQSLDSFIRNSNNLVIRENIYSASPPSYTWAPSLRLFFTYNSFDTLTEAMLLNYNMMTSTFDTSGKYKNIKFHYYNKYDLNACVLKKYEYHNYSSGTFTPSFNEEVTYDNFNNLTKLINKSWNGSAFNDTTFGLVRTIYYKSGTTIGEIDSIVEKIKVIPNMPFDFSEKYIYKGIQVTGINDLVNMKEAFRLYPVPASDFVNITPMTGYTIDEVNIFDLQGRLVGTVHNQTPHGNISINVSNLSQGYYGIQIITKEGNKFQSKIIKN